MAGKQQTALLPAYAAVGSDALKSARVLEKMDARLVEAGGDPDFDREVLEGDKVADAALLRSALDTLPFLGPFRLVVIKDVDKAPRDIAEAIVSYLGNPCATTVLMMTAAKLAKTTRLYKAVAKGGASAIIDCTPKKGYELAPHVVEMARAHGISLDHEAADTLVRLLGESTVLIDNELRKLAASYPGGRVGAAQVAAMVPRVAEIKPWDFTDALGRRDPALASRLYAQMPDKETYPLFLSSVSFIRELLCAKVLDARRQQDQLAAEVGALRGRPVQAWQVKNHIAWSRRYTLAELSGALKSAAECDGRLKSGSDKDGAFLAWVLSFCS